MSRRWMGVYKRSALAQIKVFAATRALRECERSIQEKSALLIEAKQKGDAETIAAVERTLAELERELHLARRKLAQAQYRG